MRRALALLLLAGCTHGLPKPGSPDALSACENLRLMVRAINVNYPENPDTWADELARESFLLQAKEYGEAMECGDIGLPKGFE